MEGVGTNKYYKEKYPEVPYISSSDSENDVLKKIPRKFVRIRK
jgi:hypothetical protein